MQLTRGTGFDTIPAGVYNAVLTDVDPVESEWQGQARTQLKMRFEEVEGGFTFYCYSGYSKDGAGPSLNEKTKLGQLFRALGIDPDELTDEELEDYDIDALFGKPVQLVVQDYKRQDGTPSTKVTSILPPPQPKARRTAPQASGRTAEGPRVNAASVPSGGGRRATVSEFPEE